MKSRSFLYVMAALLVISGLSYAGWRIVHERQTHLCAACQRHIHGESRTAALVNGKKLTYCCPACAISQQRQTGARVDVVSLTDFDRKSQIDPARAYVVRGSDVNSCSHAIAAAGMDKHPMEAHFDRCSPSLLAFADKQAAERFARQHGGQVLTYENAAALSK
jgi:hypothetical protein